MIFKLFILNLFTFNKKIFKLNKRREKKEKKKSKYYKIMFRIKLSSIS